MTAILTLEGKASAVTEQTVRNCITPPATRSYCPLPYGDILDMIQEPAYDLGFKLIKSEYALSNDSQRFFGTMTFDTGHPAYALNFGFRSSHDKTMSAVLVAGVEMAFICANLCYQGDALQFMRKHTRNAYRDVKREIANTINNWEQPYQNTIDQLESLKQIECSETRGAELIGLAQYNGYLKSTAANVARQDWRVPRHQEFAERNLFSLYNCFTQGTKSGDGTKMIDRQIKVDTFFQEVAA